jgi:hypothetical protein
MHQLENSVIESNRRTMQWNKSDHQGNSWMCFKGRNFNRHLHRIYSHFSKNQLSLEWNISTFYITKETVYSNTSINNDYGDEHSNMSGFILKSLVCFWGIIICCHVMYNCNPFMDSHKWRYCICQKISP